MTGLHLILASNSPRRRELLSLIDPDYTLAAKYGCEENCPADIAPENVPEYLSRLKSDAFSGKLSAGEVLVTADTIVVLDGQILGKPSDMEDAVRMLENLSGRTHKVVTGVTLRSMRHLVTFSDTTLVEFSDIPESDIRYYVETFRPLDKAGAYGVQEWIGATAIKAIHGSYYNVVGLPTEKLYHTLCLNEPLF